MTPHHEWMARIGINAFSGIIISYHKLNQSDNMSDAEEAAPPAADAPVDAKPEDAPENGGTAENGGGGDAPLVGTKDTVRLYLGNLSYETDESRLRTLFSEFGEVTDVFLPSDRMSGRPRGVLIDITTT